MSESKITPFATKVYDYLGTISCGKVTTYKNVAIAIGCPKAYRAVGTALKNNPFAPIVPCHRVVNSNLSIGAYMGEATSQKKQAMLISEGIPIRNNKLTDITLII